MSTLIYKQRWSKKDFEACHEDFDNGMTVKELAVKYNRTEGSVLVQLNKSSYHKITADDTFRTLEEKNNKVEKKKEKKEEKHKENSYSEMIEKYKHGKTVKDLMIEYKLDKFVIVYCLTRNILSNIPKMDSDYIPENRRKNWTGKELDFLMMNSKDLYLEDLAKKFKRTPYSIVCQQILLHNCPLLE